MDAFLLSISGTKIFECSVEMQVREEHVPTSIWVPLLKKPNHRDLPDELCCCCCWSSRHLDP